MKNLVPEDVEESISFMKRMNSIGEVTEPWGTPTLSEWG